MNTSTIEIPISNYDVNENLPDLLENKQSFTEHCIIKIGFPVKEHLIKIKFIADPVESLNVNLIGKSALLSTVKFFFPGIIAISYMEMCLIYQFSIVLLILLHLPLNQYQNQQGHLLMRFS